MDVVLCTPPVYDNDFPVLAPSILCSVVRNNNFKIKYIDLNQDLYKKKEIAFNGDIKNWKLVDVLFNHRTKEYLKYNRLNAIFDIWVNRMISYSPRFIAFSMLSIFNYLPTIELSKRIKEKNPNIKIVVGGVASEWFEKYLKENNLSYLVDYFVIGYGEQFIIDLLKNKITERISYYPTLDLRQKIISDYSDYDLDSYLNKGIYTYTSRGCINNCTFCGVRNLWKDFNTREVDHVIEEMNTLSSKYDITTFKTADSIMNAVLPYLRKFCMKLKDYDYKWDCMFSIRSIMKPSDYDLMAGAGCTKVFIGVESGSCNVRKHMRKRFSNEDLIKTLENLNRVKIMPCLMFIVGYPTETEEDFNLSKKLISEIASKKFNPAPSIRVQFISLDNIEELQMYADNENVKKKYDRYKELRDYIQELNCFTLQQDIRLKNWYDNRQS